MAWFAAKWILRNTIISRDSITPEIQLRLITEASPLWMATPDKCPLSDPYWAFYWPGGQAVTRYILDNPSVFSHRRIVDFGAGCGSASIAACMVGSREVIVNDIDTNALIATKINARLNGVNDSCAVYVNDNLVNDTEQLYLNNSVDFIILGDMFYDTNFAGVVFSWLKRMKNRTGATILVGDPDRHPLREEAHSKYTTPYTKKKLKTYALPGYVTREHYGFTTSHVYEILFPQS